MNENKISDELLVREGVSVTFEQNEFHIKGQKGEVVRKLYAPGVTVKVENQKIIFGAQKKFTLRHKRLISTYKAHLKNTFRGVAEGHKYVLKICSGHFPMNVTVKGNTLEIKNLLGETIPRTYTVPENCQVKVDGDRITVTGVDKELVAQCAASIEQTTRRPGFDKRVFQDGVYIIEKDGKVIA